MKRLIITTPKELMDLCVWGDYCLLAGVNEWAVNEDLMDGSEEITISEEHAKKLGIFDSNREE